MKSKDISLAAVFAAMYASLVYLFAPISFSALQFRVAGILRPAIAKKWTLAIGYAVGVFVGNIFSPYVGFHELVFMPLMSLIAGLCGYAAGLRFDKSYFVTGFVIATIISASVSWMLDQLLGLPMWATMPYLFASEQIVCLTGAVFFRLIDKRFRWWQ
ncbi:MAG: QueT transporter family protein [Nitrososphaerota archaeon]|nr:QueT transporter family protein [Candidatus Bathyarchaeota archaeon]MDW8048225.1 QueT transporter family protein [Nitrososphaerota archaeon]